VSGSINFDELAINSISFSCFSLEGGTLKVKEFFTELERTILKSNPLYGYYYSDECTNDPIYYAAGIYSSGGNRRDPSGLPLRFWSNAVALTPKEKRPWHAGIIRDVYEANFLNELHLNTIFNGMPFSSWVNKSPRFGQLDQVAPNLWRWQVRTAELAFVRAELKGSPIASLESYLNKIQAEQHLYVPHIISKNKK
jgi:hypothetical protein